LRNFGHGMGDYQMLQGKNMKDIIFCRGNGRSSKMNSILKKHFIINHTWLFPKRLFRVPEI
jgi:hypothetical protein